MIKLDEWYTMFLLLTKNWEHKDIPKKADETKFEYSKRLFEKRCGVKLNDNDVKSLWLGVAEKVFDGEDWENLAVRLFDPNNILYTNYKPEDHLLGVMSCLKVQGVFELDESLVKGK